MCLSLSLSLFTAVESAERDILDRLLNHLPEGACDQIKECGHVCLGVRGEAPNCLPCLYCPAPEDDRNLPRATDACPIYMDELSSGACIQLTSCGHILHLECVESQLKKGFPGPRISFNFINCPFCQEEMSHPRLQALLQPILTLRQTVQERALNRLRIEGRMGDRKIVGPNEPFFQNPTGFAMHTYCYYQCARCQKPYFGGEARCLEQQQQEGDEGAGGHDPENLVCPSCVAGAAGGAGNAVCGKHGDDFQGYKCFYCCSMAVFFCYGNTHYCNTCHAGRYETGVPCPVGPKSVRLNGPCPLKLKQHPPTGTRYYLGCAACLEEAAA